jgi:hypothetical protein
MAVKIGSARIDENGSAYNGKAGDQTGKEVSTQSWYESSKGWVLLRAKSAEAREKIAGYLVRTILMQPQPVLTHVMKEVSGGLR